MAGELAGDRDRDDRASLAAAARAPASAGAAGGRCGRRARAPRPAVPGGGARASTLARSGRRWCQAASTSSRRACVLPVLVIAPWRRRSPVESSLGRRGRGTGRGYCGRKRVQSPISTVKRERGQRRDAAQTAEPADDLGERRLGGELDDRPVERVAARLRLQHRAVALVEGELRAAALSKRCRRSQRVVGERPGRRRRRPARAATAASRADAGHASDRRARPRARAPDHAPPPRAARGTRTASSSPSRKQPRQPLRVTTIGLDPIARRTRDLRRRRHRARDPRRRARPRQPVPGRPSLIRDPHRPRQRRQPRDRLRRPAGTRRRPQAHRSTASNTPATTDRACTSSPTQLPSAIPAPPVIAALPPRQSRRQPAPTYERGAGPPHTV